IPDTDLGLLGRWSLLRSRRPPARPVLGPGPFHLPRRRPDAPRRRRPGRRRPPGHPRLPGRAGRPGVRLLQQPPYRGDRLMRRIFVLALALVLLGGCGMLTPSAGGSSATGPLQVWIMEPGAPELRAFLTSATADFEAAHRGDRVEVQFVPWASAHDQFVTAIGGR